MGRDVDRLLGGEYRELETARLVERSGLKSAVLDLRHVHACCAARLERERGAAARAGDNAAEVRRDDPVAGGEAAAEGTEEALVEPDMDGDAPEHAAAVEHRDGAHTSRRGTVDADVHALRVDRSLRESADEGCQSRAVVSAQSALDRGLA